MSELEERIKRIEKVLTITWKLARVVKRNHNSSTKIFNENFELLQERVDRNEHNIDQMTKALQELVGDAAKYDEANKDKDIGEDSKNDTDIRKLYI